MKIVKTWQLLLAALMVACTLYGATATIHYYDTFKYNTSLADWHCENATITVNNTVGYLEIGSTQSNGFCYYDSPTTYDKQVGVVVELVKMWSLYMTYLSNYSVPSAWGVLPPNDNSTTWWYWSDSYGRGYSNASEGCCGGGFRPWNVDTVMVFMNFSTGLHEVRAFGFSSPSGSIYARNMLNFDKLEFNNPTNPVRINRLCIADKYDSDCDTCPEKWVEYNASFACNTTDWQGTKKLYVDWNECGTTASLPVDNGTLISVTSCNYCSEDIEDQYTSWTECELPELLQERIHSWVDNNFAACCDVTGLPTDCHILNGSYSNSTEEQACRIRYSMSDLKAIVVDWFGTAGAALVRFTEVIIIMFVISFGMVMVSRFFEKK